MLQPNDLLAVLTPHITSINILHQPTEDPTSKRPAWDFQVLVSDLANVLDFLAPMEQERLQA